MILVIGGQASGKRTYAASLGFGDAIEASELVGQLSGLLAAEQGTRPWEGGVVLHAHELARDKQLSSDVSRLADALSAAAVITTIEVGCGIVPIDADERAWRERAGRLNEALAARADTVVRMVCGIPSVLKSRDGRA